MLWTAFFCWYPFDLSLEGFLPSKEMAIAVCALNRAYHNHLCVMYDVWGRDAILDHMALNNRHYLWWDAVRDEYVFQDIKQRRENLAKIINLIGWENYLQGNWPLPYPH